ncbi:ANTAR domain-containing protein [Streptomyces sp. SAS_270]|uniref:ANTAR domain-containing protein n=1 Tax=Streptomyces sp. SAS_270 TaxID=3412748 RepID=UPI00403CB32E
MTTPFAPQRLARAFVELAGATLGEPSDPSRVLATLASHGTDLLGCCAAMARYAPDGPASAQLAGTDGQLRQLERDALQWGEGPGHDAQTTGRTVPDAAIDGDHGTGRAWTRYAPRALALGYRRAAAFPMITDIGGEEATGALVLLCTSDAPLSAEVLDLAQSLTDAAAFALAQEREVRESRALAEQLGQALTSRVVIEQAKGVLAAGLSVSVDDAFARLRGHARAHRRRLPEVAQEVVDGRLDLTGDEGLSAARRQPAGRRTTANRTEPEGGR